MLRLFKPVNGWTRESIINHIQTHFKGRSNCVLPHSDGDIGCAYRGPAGRKCGVGMFIPDDRYDSRMEGWGAADIIHGHKLDDVMPLDGNVMAFLQVQHDDATTDEECLTRMVGFIHENVV